MIFSKHNLLLLLLRISTVRIVFHGIVLSRTMQNVASDNRIYQDEVQ